MHVLSRAMPMPRVARFRLQALAMLCLSACLAACSTAADDGRDKALNTPAAFATIADAAAPGHIPATGRVLVKFKPQAGEADKAALRESLGAGLARVLGSIGVEVWELPSGADMDSALMLLNASPLVEYAEPDVVRRPRTGEEGSARTGGRP